MPQFSNYYEATQKPRDYYMTDSLLTELGGIRISQKDYENAITKALKKSAKTEQLLRAKFNEKQVQQMLGFLREIQSDLSSQDAQLDAMLTTNTQTVIDNLKNKKILSKLGGKTTSKKAITNLSTKINELNFAYNQLLENFIKVINEDFKEVFQMGAKKSFSDYASLISILVQAENVVLTNNASGKSSINRIKNNLLVSDSREKQLFQAASEADILKQILSESDLRGREQMVIGLQNTKTQLYKQYYAKINNAFVKRYKKLVADYYEKTAVFLANDFIRQLKASLKTGKAVAPKSLEESMKITLKRTSKVQTAISGLKVEKEQRQAAELMNFNFNRTIDNAAFITPDDDMGGGLTTSNIQRIFYNIGSRARLYKFYNFTPKAFFRVNPMNRQAVISSVVNPILRYWLFYTKVQLTAQESKRSSVPVTAQLQKLYNERNKIRATIAVDEIPIGKRGKPYDFRGTGVNIGL